MCKEKCCGNCKRFENESIDGRGWCIVALADVGCEYCCPNHEFNNNGWTEITPDNMDEVYNVQVNRLVIAWEQGGMTVCRMLQDMSPTISTMAKIGGYYYMELPELKLDGTE